MKIILKILLVVVLLTYMFAAPRVFEKKAGERLCRKVSVVINDSASYQFVTSNKILGMVNERNDSILGRKVNRISTHELEKKILSVREVKEVQAWFDITGTLTIMIDQRSPIMRVIPDAGGDYLVDDEGILFRKNTEYAPRLHVVGGDITINRKMLDGISVLDTAVGKTILTDVYQLVSYINSDKFWSAQIDQIYVTSKNKLELIPRVGNHVVKFGSLEGYETKMESLGLFYEKVMPEAGWDKYSEINLEYDEQIICKRRL